jgi:hypothetical protein
MNKENKHLLKMRFIKEQLRQLPKSKEDSKKELSWVAKILSKDKLIEDHERNN